MRIFGQCMRFILNINTIWGLMILTAFVLCVVQHYQATTTRIPAECFAEGENTVTIRVLGSDKETRDFEYTLTRKSAALVIHPEDQGRQADRPWLISATPVEGGFLLKWDYQDYGKYQVAVDGRIVKKDGRLVTLQSLTDAAFDYAVKGFEIALGFVASMVLLLGLMKVGEDAGIVQLVAKVFYPIIRFLFPDVPKEHPASGAILMNWTTTLLGLGNAATPFGLKAMKELQELNPHPEIATDSQVMLLGYNTAGLALLPTTLLAMRKAAGCTDPFEIIGTCMLAGAVATVTAIVMVKILGKLSIFSVRAAVAEQASEKAAMSAAAGASSGSVGEDA
jgi:spore maturation protein A